MEVLKGKQVRKMRDKTGSLMTDAYLISQLEQKHSWTRRVYERTSGYVHLSETHFYNTVVPMVEEHGEAGIVQFQIGPGDAFEGDEVYEEATATFVEATKVLMTHLVGWVRTKEKEAA
jgi:hypothetical protein